MIPIQELLHRIQWDREFARGDFMVGYFDRLLGRVVVVPLGSLRFDPHDHFSFELTDVHGNTHVIPLHRVRMVQKNGEIIWQRGP